MQDSIKFCNSLEIEVSKEEYYNGGAKWNDIKNLLTKKIYFDKRINNKSFRSYIYQKNYYDDILNSSN